MSEIEFLLTPTVGRYLRKAAGHRTRNLGRAKGCALIDCADPSCRCGVFDFVPLLREFLKFFSDLIFK